MRSFCALVYTYVKPITGPISDIQTSFWNVVLYAETKYNWCTSSVLKLKGQVTGQYVWIYWTETLNFHASYSALRVGLPDYLSPVFTNTVFICHFFVQELRLSQNRSVHGRLDMRHLRFSWWWRFKSRSSGLRRRVVSWYDTNVAGVLAAFIFRVKWLENGHSYIPGVQAGGWGCSPMRYIRCSSPAISALIHVT